MDADRARLSRHHITFESAAAHASLDVPVARRSGPLATVIQDLVSILVHFTIAMTLG